jgi:hypothetical protein
MRKQHDTVRVAGPLRKNETVRLFGPILDTLRELGGSGTPSEVADLVAINEHLPQAILKLKDKEVESLYYKQIEWAGKYLIREGLVDSSIRGTWKLTKEGWDAKLTYVKARKIFLKWLAINQKARIWNPKVDKEVSARMPQARSGRKWTPAPMRQTRSGTGIIVNVQNTKRTEKFSEERTLARDKRMYTTKAERMKINEPWSKWLPKVFKRKK